MVYEIIAGRTQKDRDKFKLAGTILLGKHYVQMDKTLSLSNPIYLDVSSPHVILVAGKRGCLTGETLVLTDKGYKPIKEFKETEDKVLSFNKENKSFRWEPARLLRYPTYNEMLFRVEFSDGRSLILTREHPLLVANGDEVITLLWIKAGKLKPGDCILSIGKSPEDLIPLQIKKIENISGIKEVYDLTVPKNHSFVANGLISHNSGKSYTLGIIAEGMADLPPEISSNISCLIFDTMGIYWTMKYPNYRDDELLAKWDLRPRAMKPQIFVPFGLFSDYQDKGVPVDYPFALKPSEISAEDWCSIFKIDLISEEGVLLERAIESSKEKYGDFEINQLVSMIRSARAENKTKDLLENRFSIAQKWGLFRKDGTEITELFKGGTTTVLDLSAYAQQEGGERIKALVIGLVSKKILEQRMVARKAEEVKLISEGGFLIGESVAVAEEKAPLVWIFVDECHEFLPRESEKPTLASGPLIQLLREGRQPGISLVLATQQPGKIHTDVMTQSDIVISHRVTAKIDVDSLNLIASTYLPFQIQKYIDELPATRGAAILIDDKLEKIYPIQVRPKFSWHGGADPSAIRGELRALGIL